MGYRPAFQQQEVGIGSARYLRLFHSMQTVRTFRPYQNLIQ